MNDIAIIGSWERKYILGDESRSPRHEDICKVRLTFVLTHKGGKAHSRLGLRVSTVPPLALSWKLLWRRD